jgi:hypothetical protein
MEFLLLIAMGVGAFFCSESVVTPNHQRISSEVANLYPPPAPTSRLEQRRKRQFPIWMMTTTKRVKKKEVTGFPNDTRSGLSRDLQEWFSFRACLLWS